MSTSELKALRLYGAVMSPAARARRNELIQDAEYLISVVKQVLSEGRGSNAQKGCAIASR